MRNIYSIVFILLFFDSSSHLFGINYRSFQKKDRFPYEIKLLEIALKNSLENPNLTEIDLDVNYARGMEFLESGHIDFAFFASNDKLEKRFRAIKIPILDGILGLRINLIHKDDKSLFKNVRKLNDITDKFLAGFNSHWPDKVVLTSNNMPTTFSSIYKTLFVMLNNKRFTYFPRGINEVWTEQESNIKDAPNIIVEPHIAFFYPYPVFFFVNKENRFLANAIEKGLRMALDNGSFKAWFKEYHAKFIQKANIPNRVIIPLNNPDLPSGFKAPPNYTSWWK